MNRIFLFFALFIFMSFAFVGCSNDKNEEALSVELIFDNTDLLQNGINIGYEGGEVVLNFIINADWEISLSGDEDWCVVSPLQGKAGNNTIRIMVSPNITEVKRTVTLSFLSGNLFINDLIITQQSKENFTPSYVAIDWNKTELISSNPKLGTYSFEFDDEDNIPNINVGSSIVIDADTTGFVAVVKKINKNKKLVSVETQKGSLCDIFSDTEITLSTNENITRSKGNVYYPVEVIYHNARGEMCTLSRSDSRSETSITGTLWKWGKDFEGTSLYSNEGFDIYLSEANIDVAIDLEMVLNFGGSNEVEMIMDGVHRYKSEALSVFTNIVGTISSVLEITLEANAGIKYDDYGLWLPNIFAPIRIKFMVADVPIWITLSADLYKGCSFKAEGDLMAKVGCYDKAQGRLGVKWEQFSEELTPMYEYSNEFQTVPPMIIGKGNVSAKTCVAPHISINLYDMIGPSFELKPYISTEFSGGFKEELFQSDGDYCAWNLDCNAGIDADAGLNFTFLNFEPKEYMLSQMLERDLNLFDEQLYESPTGISFASSSSSKVVSDVPMSVSFNVYDNNYILENPQILTPLSQLVKFEGNGSLKSKYGIAKNGVVTAEWTPESSADTLFARLYDLDGDVIYESKFYGESPKAMSGNVTDITENSALVNCSYENIPKGSEYGIVLIVDDTSQTLNFVSDGKDCEQVFRLQDLESGSTYSYYAYIRYKDNIYKGEVISFKIKEKIELTEGQAIDLGLSVKWAAWNIGATRPEESGNYYAWGEIEKKSIYEYKTYNYWQDLDESEDYILPNCEGGNCINNAEFVNIGNNISGTIYDVAHVKWGGRWRMPTYDECLELQKCKQQWTKYNGVDGLLITGPNGNSIFLPAVRYKGEYILGGWSKAWYWTSTIHSFAANAYYLGFSDDEYGTMMGGCFRWWGAVVRPVCD